MIKSGVEFVEMPESTKEFIREVLSQNRSILEENFMLMQQMGLIAIIVGNTDEDAGNKPN